MGKFLALLCICGCFSVPAAFPQRQPQGSNNPLSGGNRAFDFMNDAFSSMEKAFDEMDSEPSPEDAYYLGRAVAANILTAYRPYTANPELTLYLNRICQTLLIGTPQIELFNGSYVVILDSPEYNAFASPGGHIFVTRGLVESTSSEDMLAAIIAHELAHIKLKHGINAITDMRFNDEIAGIANRAADLAGNSQAARRLMEFRNSVATVIDTMFKNGYSQSQELEADQEALAFLAASGYDPGALLEVLKVLQRTENPSNSGFNTTHPSPEERIVNAERWISRYRVQDTRSHRIPRFRNR